MKSVEMRDTLCTRIANAARQRPDQPAVVDGDARLTYAELEQEADRIARHIVAVTGKAPGNVCVLATDRIAAVKSIFGAIRSGHVVVSLDAGDPEGRLHHILEDSSPVAVLTDPSQRARARELAPAGCVVIDVIDIVGDVAATALPVVDRASPAYISYTSGSTGQPKGVIQTHANMLFFINSYTKDFGLDASDRMSMLYTLGVPAGFGAILRGIALGATLHIYDARRNGIAALADWLDAHRITYLQAVPTVIREMASRMGPKRVLPHLRVVHMGGEAVFSGDVALVRAHTLDHCVIQNQLASTEVGVMARNILRHDATVNATGIVAAGYPIDGVHVGIYREDGSVAAPDEIGALIVSSAHTSPGYWRRPDLDAMSFSDDPHRPGWRRYRSGDLGRIDAGGVLWFAGRTGARVKVHGHSVDLMEVEAALITCPGVVRAAVVAINEQSQSDSSRIVAYIESRDDTARDPTALRRHIASRLPFYMSPSAIAYVESMPLTVGGKIDRNRLADMPTLPSGVSTPHEAPRDEVESVVARLFEELMMLDSVGATDDFYLLGGDSLLGAELQARLARKYGVRISNLHEDATVAGIAAQIRHECTLGVSANHDVPILLPLWKSGSEVPFFMVHGRNGQAFVSPHFMRLLGDNQPVWSFQARGLDGRSEPNPSVEAMADDYLAELRRVRPHGPYFLGSLCAGAFIVTIIARRLHESGETVLPLLLLDPPNSVFQPGYLNMTQQQFETKMRARKANGGSGGSLDDPFYMQALVRTMLAFERAIALHRPKPFDGEVFMLSSTARMRGEDAGHFLRMFTGKVARHEVGPGHNTVLNPHNPVFASALLQCLAQIRNAARITVA